MARWQPDSGARVHLATKPDVDLKFPMAALASSNAFNSSSLPTHFGKSVTEIAETERVDITQVRRVMRLTPLAPKVVERLVGSPDPVQGVGVIR